MATKILLGSDHAGFQLKEEVKKFLDKQKIQYEDLGVFSDEPSDYPDIAYKLAEKAAKSNSKGILMCGTGIGESIVANKVRGVRAANCFNEYTAQKSREHNDSNVLCLGARVLSSDDSKKIIRTWLETGFSGEERHKRRLGKISAIESKICR